MSSSELRKRQVPAHPSVHCFSRPRRIVDAGGNDGRQAALRLLAEEVLQEISGRKPVVYVSHADAAAHMCAAAVSGDVSSES